MIRIRKANEEDLHIIKSLVDLAEEMDTTESTFPISYFRRLMRDGIIYVATANSKVVGVCFGTYNGSEGWADILGLVVVPKYRDKNIAKRLVGKFEHFVKRKKIKTIDLYANPARIPLFKQLGYKQGRPYISFRKIAA